MNVQEEQSGEASAGGNSEEEGEDESEDESEEDAEDSGGSDSHSDPDCDVESEEESVGPEQEQRRAPGERPEGHHQEAREAAGAELPYTFAGDKRGGFPWFGDGVQPGSKSASLGLPVEWGRGDTWTHPAEALAGGEAWSSSMSFQCCLGAWHSGGLCDVNTDGKRADPHLPVAVPAFGVGRRLQRPGPGLGTSASPEGLPVLR